MRHGKLSAAAFAFALCVIGVAISAGWTAAATLTGMSVSSDGEVTRIHVMLDEPVEFSHFALTDPARLFLDCRGVDTVLPKSLPSGQGRAGAIEASVWQGDGQYSMTRITIDLTSASDATVEAVEGGLMVLLEAQSAIDWSPDAVEETSSTLMDQAETETSPEVSESSADEAEVADDTDGSDHAEAADDAGATDEVALAAGPVAASETGEVDDLNDLGDLDELEDLGGVDDPTAVDDLAGLESLDDLTTPAEEAFDYALPDQESESREYKHREPSVTSYGVREEAGLAARGGTRVSLDIQGADIYTVLRSISEYSGVNIVMGYDVPEEIKAPVSFHLENVPWGEALEMVLRSAHLWYREDDNIIRVDTEENLRDEELARTNAVRQLEEVMPLTTRIVEVVYANAGELKPTLERSLSRRGVIDVDTRTNSILITDINRRVEAAVDMVRHLDSQTPQIEIISKLVDVDAKFSRDLGVLWGVGGIHSSEGVSLEALAGANDVLNPAAMVRFGVVRSWGSVSAILSALEQDNRANIISNPRITTVNNRMARILVGKRIPLIVLDEAGNAVTELVTIGITLRVTPHINDQNRITLDLHPEVSDLSSQATVQGGVIINTSEADTRVMVNNGETAVIGGLIRSNETTLERGVPILKNIPLVGSLFRNSSKVQEKRELLIFVTPRIVSSFSANED